MIVIIFIVGFFLIVLRIVQIAWFSPLSAFPNAHFLAPLTPLWLLWIKYTKRENSLRNSLHEKLGPVIRIGRRELSINDTQSVKVVYKGGFNKTEWYSAFRNYGEDVLFSTIDSKPHSERKRMLSNVYSKSHVQASPELNTILDSVTASVKRELDFYAEDNRAFDFYKLTKSFGMDITTAYLFGLGVGTNFTQASRATNPLEIFQTALNPEGVFLNNEIPGVLSWMERIGIQPISNAVFSASKSMEDLCLSMCETAKKKMHVGKERGDSLDEKERDGRSYGTVYAQFYNKLQESGIPAERADNIAAAEMLDEMIAGNEIIGVILTYLIWELAIHPEMHRRLQEEIRTCLREHRSSESNSLLPPGKIIDALPILDAVLQETLRFHPGGFGPFPRVVPNGGAQLEGVKIPAGTVISASAYALHKNNAVFPRANEWRPERWIDANEDEMKEMQRWFWAFGSGGRMCIGKHLAERMMKAFIVAIYTEYEWIVAGQQIPEQDQIFFGTPKGNKVFMEIRKIV